MVFYLLDRSSDHFEIASNFPSTFFPLPMLAKYSDGNFFEVSLQLFCLQWEKVIGWKIYSKIVSFKYFRLSKSVVQHQFSKTAFGL